jgi:hypothetical protein
MMKTILFYQMMPTFGWIQFGRRIMSRTRKIPKWNTDRYGNPVAKTLSQRKFQQKIVRSGKEYRRMRKHEIKTDEEN